MYVFIRFFFFRFYKKKTCWSYDMYAYVHYVIYNRNLPCPHRGKNGGQILKVSILVWKSDEKKKQIKTYSSYVYTLSVFFIQILQPKNKLVKSLLCDMKIMWRYNKKKICPAPQKRRWAPPPARPTASRPTRPVTKTATSPATTSATAATATGCSTDR